MRYVILFLAVLTLAGCRGLGSAAVHGMAPAVPFTPVDYDPEVDSDGDGNSVNDVDNLKDLPPKVIEEAAKRYGSGGLPSLFDYLISIGVGAASGLTGYWAGKKKAKAGGR